jgi:recombinational DNA repair protein (RecF pathway)
MTPSCAACSRPLDAMQTRPTRYGPICGSCGQIADMQLRAANDTVFEDWQAGCQADGHARAGRDGSDAGS